MSVIEESSPYQDERPPSLPQIFLSFLRLGVTAFGGPAMIVHIRSMAVQKKRWLDEPTFRNGLALCQTIPGATAMQVCAFVGLRARGVRGAAASYIGFALPAFLLMIGLSALYSSWHSLPVAASVFASLRALVVALIAHAAVTSARAYIKRWQDIVIVPVAAALLWVGISPILVVMASAVLGIVLSLNEARTPEKVKEEEKKSFPLRPVLIISGAAVLGLLALFLFDRMLFDLSLIMLRVDLFAFGGGFASVPLMLHEVVDLRHWLDQKTFLDGIALGQVTPGPVVITATFVGYVVRGVWGAIVSTASIFLPSFIILVSVAPVFSRLNSLPLFRKGIAGVLCSFVGLLLSVSIKLGLAVAWDIPRAALAIAAFVALMFRVNLLWVVLGGIGIAVLFRF